MSIISERVLLDGSIEYIHLVDGRYYRQVCGEEYKNEEITQNLFQYLLTDIVPTHCRLISFDKDFDASFYAELVISGTYKNIWLVSKRDLVELQFVYLNS